MDIDLYEDEVIIYLWDDKVKQMKREGSIYEEVEDFDDFVEVSIHYSPEPKDNKGERFDDVLDALEEIDQMLWQLEEGDDFEDIKDEFEWRKVTRTYEYYDKIRQQY